MNKYGQCLQELKAQNNYRRLPDRNTLQLTDLCSNDYLGISKSSELREEFLRTWNGDYAFSASSSRLLSVSLEQHVAFEHILAENYKSEAALLFNSGYHANTGILSALTARNDLIIADKLIHASIIDGAGLSAATFMRYRHLDYEHLEHLLQKYRKHYDEAFIVSESIFSMDGDVADLKVLIELKKKYNCHLYVDEAHALGVRGNKGLGCVEEDDCMTEVDFVVGTMGKAMGSVGAFVVCKQIYVDYLINHSRPFIFSTALPPLNVAWSNFIFHKMMDMGEARKHLRELSARFAAALKVQAQSHIIPYIIGANAEAVAISEMLKKNGYNVLPVRYPTVPKNTARLRFSLCADMRWESLEKIPAILGRYKD